MWFAVKRVERGLQLALYCERGATQYLENSIKSNQEEPEPEQGIETMKKLLRYLIKLKL